VIGRIGDDNGDDGVDDERDDDEAMTMKRR